MEDTESCSSRALDSPPAQSRKRRQKVEVYHELLRRLKESENEEASQLGFDYELWAHFNQLPVRYALDVNVERAEDVLVHKKLLHMAHDHRIAFEVRLVQVHPIGDENCSDSLHSSFTMNGDPQTSNHPGRQSIHLPPAFALSPNLEHALEARTSQVPIGSSGMSADLHLFRKVRHKNVVQFIGACTRPPNLCIVTEFMSVGSVYDFLHKQNGFFKLPTTLKLAIDVSKGMDYLHQNNIIHRDLKAANLLMDENEVVKVADFGVARVQAQSGVMTAETGTYRWMAPEVIEHRPYDHKADVFSFGIVLWELLTGKLPYENLTPLQAAVSVVRKVNAFRERRALALSLNDTKTAVNKLHQMLNIVVGIIVVVIWLLILKVATTHFFVFLSSQLLLVVFGNTCKTTFEAIIFLFVMHPFDVGDLCEVDDVQLVVEEMNILTTIFLRFDNQKIIYPNSVLATKPISNYYRSPYMGDAIDFCIHISTPVEKIAFMKERITSFIKNKSDHWHPAPMIVLWDMEDLNRLKISIWLSHRMNFQNMGEIFGG